MRYISDDIKDRKLDPMCDEATAFRSGAFQVLSQIKRFVEDRSVNSTADEIINEIEEYLEFRYKRQAEPGCVPKPTCLNLDHRRDGDGWRCRECGKVFFSFEQGHHHVQHAVFNKIEEIK